MTTGLRRLAGVATLILLAACTVGGGGGHHNPTNASGSPNDFAVPIPHVTPGGAPTLQAAIAKLCIAPPTAHGTPATGTLPPDLVSIAQGVEQARGHQYKHYPPATEVSNSQMDRRLLKNFRQTTSRVADDRRTVAWRTIGVIGPQDDLYRAYRAFTTGQVVGYYDPETGDLVYLGSGSLDFSERFTLAHELTHALDDQTFDLTRLDPLTAHCQDDRAQAALGLVEGSAQYFAAVAVAQNPSIDLGDLLKAIADAASSGNPPPGVPQFVFASAALAVFDRRDVRRVSRRFGRDRSRRSRIRALPRLDRAGDRSRDLSVGQACSRADPRRLRSARATMGRPRRDDDRGGVAPRHAGAS